MTAPRHELACSAMLLDLDGVLVDSSSTVERSWRRWAVRNQLPEDMVLAACHGRPSAETVRAVAGHLDAAAEARRLEQEQAEDIGDLVACPGAADLLDALPPDAWAVVTSGSRPLATGRLRAVGLPVPNVLVAADDVRRGKPEPDGYLAGAAGLGVPPARCTVVEDAAPGVRAARAAGCQVVGVLGPLLGAEPDVDALVANVANLSVSISYDTEPRIRLRIRRTSRV